MTAITGMAGTGTITTAMTGANGGLAARMLGLRLAAVG